MNRVERVRLEEMFVQLAADAIQRQHPQAAWLVEKGRLPVPLSDPALEHAVERLGVWLAEHGEVSGAPEVAAWIAERQQEVHRAAGS